MAPTTSSDQADMSDDVKATAYWWFEDHREDLSLWHSTIWDLVDPREAERRLRELIPPVQRNWTSDDYVEMTWYAPTARLYVGRPALAPRADGKPYQDRVMNALGGIPAAIDPTVQCAGRTVAGSLLDLLRDGDALARARAELDRRRAEAGVAPLLPPDYVPPVDYGWPAYVDGDRCVPDPVEADHA